jgi:hypothetical protein
LPFTEVPNNGRELFHRLGVSLLHLSRGAEAGFRSSMDNATFPFSGAQCRILAVARGIVFGFTQAADPMSLA